MGFVFPLTPFCSSIFVSVVQLTRIFFSLQGQSKTKFGSRHDVFVCKGLQRRGHSFPAHWPRSWIFIFRGLWTWKMLAFAVVWFTVLTSSLTLKLIRLLSLVISDYTRACVSSRRAAATSWSKLCTKTTSLKYFYRKHHHRHVLNHIARAGMISDVACDNVRLCWPGESGITRLLWM